MAFANDAEFQDDFRKVGHDATAGFEPIGAPDSPTEHASSENVEVAGAPKAEDDDDLEDDEDVQEDDVEPGDEDLEDDDEDLDDADVDEDENDEDEDDEDEDDDYNDDEDEEDEDDADEEDEDKAVMARLGEAEKTARAR